MFSEVDQPNQIYLEDGCVCLTKGNQEVEMVILPGTGKPVHTVMSRSNQKMLLEVPVKDMFIIQK
jgi:hypothetical protein